MLLRTPRILESGNRGRGQHRFPHLSFSTKYATFTDSGSKIGESSNILMRSDKSSRNSRGGNGKRISPQKARRTQGTQEREPHGRNRGRRCVSTSLGHSPTFAKTGQTRASLRSSGRFHRGLAPHLGHSTLMAFRWASMPPRLQLDQALRISNGTTTERDLRLKVADRVMYLTSDLPKVSGSLVVARPRS